MEGKVVSVRYAEDLNPTASHFHDCYQLLYVADGEAVITVAGKAYPAPAGTLVLIGRFESHSVRITGQRYCRYTIMVDPCIYGYHAMLGTRLLSVLMNRPTHFCHAADLSDLPQMKGILAQMSRECQHDAVMNEKMLLILLSQILVFFCRQCPENLPKPSSHLHLVQRIRQHLEDNYSCPCDLEELAQQFHLSQSHMSHIFRRITGSSIITYLTAYRLTAAKHCLIETDLPIGTVSENCGFTDQSNFGRIFKAETGLSPSQFRKKYRK